MRKKRGTKTHIDTLRFQFMVDTEGRVLPPLINIFDKRIGSKTFMYFGKGGVITHGSTANEAVDNAMRLKGIPV